MLSSQQLGEISLNELVNISIPEHSTRRQPIDFSETSFDVVDILGYRADYNGLSEYKVRWKPVRIRKVDILYGVIHSQPL